MSATTYQRTGVAVRDLTLGFRLSLIWFVVIIAIAFAVIGAIVVSVRDPSTTESVWENSAYATRYFPLSQGIMLTAVYLPVAVASGLTRRTFGYAATIGVIGISGIMAVFEAAGYLVEYWAFDLTGDVPTYATPHLFEHGYQFWISVPEVWIVVAGNVAAGWLIGSAYYRWGWLGPTLALPLLIIPALVVEALMSVGWAGAAMDAMGFERPPTWLAVTSCLAVLAITLSGVHRFVRTIDIRPQKA
ncbi:hypothetical protein [Jiangella asiatica]|uniref:Uncharacterized protein n=1 Tax=Jiangella asiatica TaxID=2530372 RepID=A0A4R5CC09_9ACTN|nr:hypothetical protein [Jiangella asiatica]TDD95800.1 hypothetical protein E1269_30995 [Jiangella asiatica]